MAGISTEKTVGDGGRTYRILVLARLRRGPHGLAGMDELAAVAEAPAAAVNGLAGVGVKLDGRYGENGEGGIVSAKSGG